MMRLGGGKTPGELQIFVQYWSPNKSDCTNAGGLQACSEELPDTRLMEKRVPEEL